MENTNINILDKIDVNTSEIPSTNVGDTLSSTKPSENSENPLDFITKYITKKNIYILCGIIIVAGLIYYFYLKNNTKSQKSKGDINIEVPPNNGNNNHYFIPLPENTPKTMTQEEYNALVQQQLTQHSTRQNQQQLSNQDNTTQLQIPTNDQTGPTVPVEIKPQVIHPGQELVDDDNTEEIELDLDNQKLTADEIKQISEQLQQLQAE